MEANNEIMSEHRTDYNMADGILMLIDDCFLELFKHLSLIDLANFKEAYPKLGAVAAMAFGRKTRGSLDFRKLEKNDDGLQITEQFGSSVRHLIIECSLYHCKTNWRKIFSVIGENCTEKLNSLSIVGEAAQFIKEADLLLMADVLKNIETLQIDTVTYCPAELLTIVSHYENARSIELCGTAFDLPETIFQTNKNLSKLQLRGWTKQLDLKRIVDNLQHTRLQELLIKTYCTHSMDGSLSELLRLKYLERLFICCGDTDANSFIRNVGALNSLTVFSLSSIAQLDGTTVATLGRSTQLKILRLKDCCFTRPYFESLLTLCQNKNLEHLLFLCHPTNFNAIDKVNFQRIIDKRKASAAENCLHLTLYDARFYNASLKSISLQSLDANKETIKLLDQSDRSYVTAYEYYGFE